MQTDVLQSPPAAGTDGDGMTAADWRRWHRTLARLRKEPKLKMSSSTYLAFAWIWLRVGAQVARGHKVYLPELATEFKKGLRSAERWLEHLHALELVVIKDRSTIGWWTMDVNYRCPEIESGADDPQLELPFMGSDNLVDKRATTLSTNVRQPCRQTCDNLVDKRATSLSQQNLEKIAERAGEGELSMGEAFRAVHGPPKATQRAPPVPKRHEKRLDVDVRNRNQIDIGIKTQEGVQAAIFQRLGDHDLRMAPVAKVAALVVADARCREREERYEGGRPNRKPLTWTDVERVIDNARQKFRDNELEAPWIYFVSAMKQAFEERGLRWSHGKRKPPR